MESQLVSNIASNTYNRAMFCLIVLVLAFAAVTHADQRSQQQRQMIPKSMEINSDEMINLVNSINTTWKAGRNFSPDTPKSYFKQLCGVKSMENVANLPQLVHKIGDLPDEFDARVQWPNCADRIGEIRDQGACGSCWAFGTVGPISDRICIKSNGKVNVDISAEDLISCSDAGGCDGGIPAMAWDYYVQSGLVTGSLYNSHQGCRPYTIAGCSHHIIATLPPCPSTYDPTPACNKTCEPGYGITYQQDKYFGSQSYIVNGEKQIMQEILTNGPVGGTLAVYADFLTYKSGVYVQHSQDFVGLHAVKILGWGVEGGVKFWLVANSWNAEWGDKGYIKIRRETNECSIDDGAFAGLPK